MDSMYHQFWIAVAHYYQKNLTESQIELYARDTEGLNENQLNDAFEKWRNENHFMPTPSDINSIGRPELVTDWQFCSDLLAIIKEYPMAGAGQESGVKKALTKFQFEVYRRNEYRDGIRHQTQKTAIYALMNSLDRIKNEETKKMRNITARDIKKIDYRD